jgi:Zn-finger nucleic acid-binding protein
MFFMNCPACNEILFTVEYDEVELDYCGECHGVWLDAGELYLLLGDHTLTEGFLTAGNPAIAKNEQVRLCPLCDSPMNKSVTGGPKPIVQDLCPKGHGTWFDSGELAAVIEQGVDSGLDSPVIRWLHSLFPEKGDNTPNP